MSIRVPSVVWIIAATFTNHRIGLRYSGFARAWVSTVADMKLKIVISLHPRE